MPQPELYLEMVKTVLFVPGNVTFPIWIRGFLDDKLNIVKVPLNLDYWSASRKQWWILNALWTSNIIFFLFNLTRTIIRPISTHLFNYVVRITKTNTPQSFIATSTLYTELIRTLYAVIKVIITIPNNNTPTLINQRSFTDSCNVLPALPEIYASIPVSALISLLQQIDRLLNYRTGRRFNGPVYEIIRPVVAVCVDGDDLESKGQLHRRWYRVSGDKGTGGVICRKFQESAVRAAGTRPFLFTYFLVATAGKGATNSQKVFSIIVRISKSRLVFGPTPPEIDHSGVFLPAVILSAALVVTCVKMSFSGGGMCAKMRNARGNKSVSGGWKEQICKLTREEDVWNYIRLSEFRNICWITL